MVQGEDKLKGSAQANLERNRQRFERKKKKTGSNLAASRSRTSIQEYQNTLLQVR